ncbi:TetR family transcriptional regulator [Comamonas sp. Y33R10-2]|uniref:TetR family transcriptional regulator n=1 Tax=Comamonas sp. Y33R10-2 TaxID=2853257 RepID=UPI001C5C933D|nr:TetR family transcriptional regulator [Comamonas sp. Y33R10-2]QXZ08363.1 TetR family transcriptional regulator [Comamonas sp. Y33R10-2]
MDQIEPAKKRVARDSEKTRAVILKAAINEFSKNGYGGATVEKIVQRAKRNERSLYYHFGNKEGLYIASLESLYEKQMLAEQALRLEDVPPEEAIRKLVRFTWSYYRENPEYLSLLNTENLYKAAHLKKSSARMQGIFSPKMKLLEQILERGAREGVFKNKVAVDYVFLLIASLCYLYVSNRYTISNYLGRNLEAPEACEGWLNYIETLVVEHLSRGGSSAD